MADVIVKQQFKVHPWRRYFARCLDHFLMASVFVAGLTIFFPSLCDKYMDLANTLHIVLIGLFTFLLTPFFISLFGATPGKYICGIQIRDKNFKKLLILTSLKREILVYMKGMAFCFPVVDIFTHISCYSRLKKQGITSWDEVLICNVLSRE
jgi:uncharacterized RDD family membrane protein YckC